MKNRNVKINGNLFFEGVLFPLTNSKQKYVDQSEL